jgi:hypothetical protein
MPPIQEPAITGEWECMECGYIEKGIESILQGLITGMQPALDLAARHSVWLHCLQSALIHHLAPILLLFAVAREPVSQARFVGGRRGLRVWVVVAFGAMSGVWMLPQLHQRLMDDATLYALMKWGMAVSGLWLCRVMGRYCHSAHIPSYKQWSFSVAVALPQLLVGLMLLCGRRGDRETSSASVWFSFQPTAVALAPRAW